jgi:hypothetical protein
MSKQNLLKKIDAAFAPDIAVKLNKKSVIVAFSARTTRGTAFLLQYAHKLFGMNFDEAMRLGADMELTFESN